MMIGIVGHGVVGAALASWFASQGRAVCAYDPPKGVGTLLSLNTCDIVFVCVPTPYIAGRGVDQRAVLEAVGALDGSKLVVIKSTVLPGTTAGLQHAYPQHRFAFNPEFLREAHAQDDMTHPDRQILGVTLQSADDADRLLAMLPPAGFSRVCLAAEAEMAKYGANAFLAVKVSFSNDLFEVCGRAGIEYEPVRDIVAADARIGGSHMDVFDGGYRGYGGKCLPKDSKALLDFASRVGAAMPILVAADAVNERLLYPAREKVRRRTAAARGRSRAPLATDKGVQGDARTGRPSSASA